MACPNGPAARAQATPRSRGKRGVEHLDITVDDAPERIGRYQIVRRLAKGGMADVFLASRCITPWDASAWFKHCKAGRCIGVAARRSCRRRAHR
jgi:hypothetical protein